jgi:hypothetical protein
MCPTGREAQPEAPRVVTKQPTQVKRQARHFDADFDLPYASSASRVQRKKSGIRADGGRRSALPRLCICALVRCPSASSHALSSVQSGHPRKNIFRTARCRQTSFLPPLSSGAAHAQYLRPVTANSWAFHSDGEQVCRAFGKKLPVFCRKVDAYGRSHGPNESVFALMRWSCTRV